MNYPNSFQLLVDGLKKLPGIGNKGAERLAFHILEMNSNDVQQLSKAIGNVQENIKYCDVCGHITEDHLCSICLDSTRDKQLIMVVEHSKDIVAIENAKMYQGLYHVLNGNINIMEGIMADDLRIDELLSRIDESIKEVIIATNPTRNGETTALYISKLLEDFDVNVTRIANGLPMGGNLDYADQLTLMKSFEGRRKFKS